MLICLILSRRGSKNKYPIAGVDMKNEYYDETFLETQKNTLLQMKMNILNHMKTHAIDEIAPDRDQIVEDVDQSQILMAQSLSMGLRDRELSRLRQIEEALAKFEDGSYGLCEETGEPIGKKRLEKIPWVKLSIDAQEEIERTLRAA
ncbi:dksA/traR C4-type zinc finger family protein [Halobacteriovorax marinus SJ]|uniref:DksA/traR C4-type zinc finger family protein n=2 Tax=Halobacteriovorax marinus TaxID=97084 RepID=E1X216_HALMS|nr:dksA/traR C4-type zinc finger family protein [Halobacteriovorax marinus SJ]